MKPSAKFSWNEADTKAFLHQAVRVLIPYAIVIIPVLIQQLPTDWAYSAIAIYILNRVYDALRRYVQGK